jgi:hypothetical protein
MPTEISSDDFVSVSSSNWATAISQSQEQQLLSSKKKTFAQVVIEDQLNSQSLYKTELCRSFEETGACRYGLKCQFAHGKDELRPVLRHPKYKTEICRTFHSTGSCPYGKRCRFIHQSPDEGNMSAINVIPWSRISESGDSDSSSGDDDSAELAEITNKLAELQVEEDAKPKVVVVVEEPQNNGGKPSRAAKTKTETTKTKPPKTDEEKAKKGNKRRLAFFARLSGDSSSNAVQTGF